ncbi:RHS repeat-associated core domain-containing protein [Pseudomonas mosselii]|uniref:RHS repeat-associated core domain-containing protein n=1 Tax=Pseudomonas mosselii TaxID=78327 RepID=UPI0030C70406
MTALLLASDRARTPLFMLASLGNVPTAFNPYGYRPACAGASTPMTGYVGQPREPALGWYLLGNGHRVYSPVVRRFHSPDRLSPFAEGGLNSYAYCQGDPINRHDRGGRRPMPLTSPSTLATTTPGGYGFTSAMNDYAGVLPLVSGVAVLGASWWLKEPFSRTSVGSVVTGIVGAGIYAAGRTMELQGHPSGADIATVGVTTMNIAGSVTTLDGLRSMWRNRPGAHGDVQSFSSERSRPPSNGSSSPTTPSVSNSSTAGTMPHGSKQNIVAGFGGGVLQIAVPNTDSDVSRLSRKSTHPLSRNMVNVSELNNLIESIRI